MRLFAALAILAVTLAAPSQAAPPRKQVPVPMVIQVPVKEAPDVVAERGKKAYEAKDFRGAIADLGNACAAGIAESCFLSAEIMRGGQLGSRNMFGALTAYRQACEKGHGQACYSFSLYQVSQTEADKVLNHTMLTRGCDLGNGEACTTLGYRQEKGQMVTADPVKARQLYLKGCELKNNTGCRNAAVAYFNGIGGEKDPAQALAYNRSACDLGHMEGCYWAANQVEEGQGTAADPVAARGLFGQYCERNHARSCSQYGYLLQKKLFPEDKRDHKGARAAYEKACRLGNAIGCSNLAIVQEWGQGGPTDLVSALKNYDKACEMRHATACAAMARMHAGGRGTVASPSIAAAYRYRACELGDEKTCKIIGN
jgi:TPR repeat protein